MGMALGTLLHRIPSRRRHIVDVNLALCFPHMTAPQRQEMALEQAEQASEGDPMSQMVGALFTGAQQGATERNVVKAAAANRASNGKPTNGSPTNGKAQI